MVSYIDPVEVNMVVNASSVCAESSGHYDVRNILEDDDSCWQSTEGNLHRVEVSIDDYILINGFEIQFHADFAARQLSVTAFCKNNKTVLMKFSPEETFDIQCFLFENPLPANQIAFKFANSNDSRGRVVVFRLNLTTEVETEGFTFQKGLTVEDVERIANENLKKQELYEEMTAKMTAKMDQIVANVLDEAGPSGNAKPDLTFSPYFMPPRTYEDPFEYMANGDYVYRVGPIGGGSDILKELDGVPKGGSSQAGCSSQAGGSLQAGCSSQAGGSSQAVANKG